MRRPPTLLVAAVGLLVGLAACDTTDPDSDTATPAAATADEDAVLDTVDDVVIACQDQDRDRLRNALAEDAQDRIRDRDRLFAEDATIEVISRTVEVDGDTATVTVVLEVTRDGEATEVERVWVLERTDDGTWLLTDVPDCLFAD